MIFLDFPQRKIQKKRRSDLCILWTHLHNLCTGNNRQGDKEKKLSSYVQHLLGIQNKYK
jgi:hypothetical protein